MKQLGSLLGTCKPTFKAQYVAGVLAEMQVDACFKNVLFVQ